MDKLGSIAKNTWNSQKAGSIRGDVKSWVGRGDDSSTEPRARVHGHNAIPISSLKDPSSFAPPPKHSAFYGTSTENSPGPSSPSHSGPVQLPPRPNGRSDAANQQAAEDIEAPPPGPFRMDTTGLSTANLPKPPVRRLNSPAANLSNQTPVSRVNTLPASTSSSSDAVTKVKKPGPPLPPRLPPRNKVAVTDSSTPTSPPPSYTQATTARFPSASEVHVDEANGLLNQGAINRLGAAGVSVPGFDIGSQTFTAKPSSVSQEAPQSIAANVSELQARFASSGPAVTSRTAEDHGSGGPPVGKKPVMLPKKNITSLPSGETEAENQDDYHRKPPPVPLGTKPR